MVIIIIIRHGALTGARPPCTPCQVNAAHALPAAFRGALQRLQRDFDLESMPMRKTPPEFQEVFSDMCV
eukprot:2616964-Pyramimonas_sp.AAC.1